MATLRWLGSAQATTDLWTVTVSGTMTSQTYTLTVNGKSVTYTADGSATATIILAGLAAAWAASTEPEHTELTALALPSGGPYTSMTLTCNTSGKPCTVSASTSGAATFAATHTTTGTGPNDFTNAKNWSTGSAPANSDTIIFDNGSVDVKYNLSTSLTGITMNVEPGYSGKIGLPYINSDGTKSYTEYRTIYMTFAGGTAKINSPSIQRCNLAFGANTTTVRVLQTSTNRIDAATPIVLITGGNGSSELDITKGDVGVAFITGTTSTFPNIKTSYVKAPAGDVTLTVGTGATLTTVTKNGGKAIINSSVTTLTQGVAGGELTIGETAAVTTLKVQGGTVFYNSTGTLATATVSGGATLSFDQDPRSKTVTNPINALETKSTVIDNQKVVNSGTLTVNIGALSSPTIQHGTNNQIAVT